MLKMWMTPFFSPIINLETSSGCQATDMTADLKATVWSWFPFTASHSITVWSSLPLTTWNVNHACSLKKFKDFEVFRKPRRHAKENFGRPGVNNSNLMAGQFFSGEHSKAMIDIFLPILRVFLSITLVEVAKFWALRAELKASAGHMWPACRMYFACLL